MLETRQSRSVRSPVELGYEDSNGLSSYDHNFFNATLIERAATGLPTVSESFAPFLGYLP